MDQILEKTLKIIHINVNSLIRLRRRYDLLKFINQHNPDLTKKTLLQTQYTIRKILFHKK